MTPGARVAAAIAVLDRWAAGTEGLDRVLAAWGRENRYAGSGDRRAVADLVYDAVRRLRSALWAGGRSDLARGAPAGLAAGPGTPDPSDRPGRPALIGSLRLDGEDPAALFTGAGHAPPPLAAGEAGGAPLDDAPQAVRLDLPDWLLAAELLGEVPEGALDRLRRRAPVFLRANRLKTDPEGAIAALAEDGILAVPGPLSPTCLAVTEGARRVARSGAFRDGLVEVQDAASQAVADLCAARPGERVLDLCAGAGGKSLALAAAMAGRGRLRAHDVSATRLAQLGPRALRAGASVEVVGSEALADFTGGCDLVLVDAPCSGSGAWARNPDAKWRLTRAALERLRAAQGALIARGAELLAPGGRLVYATCSMMPAENDRTVAAALAGLPGFTLESRRAWTPLDGGDGFFAAVLRAG
ncbi:RsmB/NOP family class I SAM-dependent RNA methyltransferase [Paralimibaculum aggregatum]|uniref:RsmB/NOP family class I SAM-dependent RNA methyltransferase n=1 Tax=Paralimibaculum aggregatum TaxID=3036245 RepID=A0ABQ6LT51_9RHOB|nr:RsmB/NOP family class I SAM-dependent RNA methyltransferase [Limibaculum sp. NKW23]GMG85265.1 RsmB/NOP family class I SAM-dependent RNA methyltransferase [Limibaculum sp. NKW23]